MASLIDKSDQAKTSEAQLLQVLFYGKSLIDIFESFFTSEVINDILTQTLYYATFLNVGTFNVPVDLNIFF